MPRLSDLLDTKRSPVSQAALDLAFAEASLNGYLARIQTTTPEALRKAVDAVYEARERLDTLRFAALGVEHLKARAPQLAVREPQPNDRDDMIDVVLIALDGVPAEGFVESGLIQNAHRRGEDLAGRAA